MEIYKPVAGVAADLSQTRIVVCDVPDIPGQAARLFSNLAKENFNRYTIHYEKSNINSLQNHNTYHFAHILYPLNNIIFFFF